MLQMARITRKTPLDKFVAGMSMPKNSEFIPRVKETKHGGIIELKISVKKRYLKLKAQDGFHMTIINEDFDKVRNAFNKLEKEKRATSWGQLKNRHEKKKN